MPNVMTGHVVPDIPLDRVKNRLSEVRGALVECPMVRVCLCAPGCGETLLTVLMRSLGFPHRRGHFRQQPRLGWSQPDAADLHLSTASSLKANSNLHDVP